MKKTKIQIASGIGGRHQKNDQQLKTTEKDSPGQSSLENPCRQSMLPRKVKGVRKYVR